jgi:lysophospholipid acyltransferase (LPLAT)-like uncharacterized protein
MIHSGPFKNSLLRAAAFFGKWIYLFYYKTLKIQILSPGLSPQKVSSRENQIYIFWHSKTFTILPYCRGSKSAILTLLDWKNLFYDALARGLGYGTVPVTSEARAALALKERLERGFHIGLAVDGPRGPRGRMRPGALYLAAKTGRTVISVRVHAEKAFRLKDRWDHYEIPFPFSRVRIQFNNPHHVADINLSEIEAKIISELGEP